MTILLMVCLIVSSKLAFGLTLVGQFNWNYKLKLVTVSIGAQNRMVCKEICIH